MQNGPASTRVRSMTRTPASGPAHVLSFDEFIGLCVSGEQSSGVYTERILRSKWIPAKAGIH